MLKKKKKENKKENKKVGQYHPLLTTTYIGWGRYSFFHVDSIDKYINTFEDRDNHNLDGIV